MWSTPFAGIENPQTQARVALSYPMGVVSRSWFNPDSTDNAASEIDAIVAGIRPSW